MISFKCGILKKKQTPKQKGIFSPIVQSALFFSFLVHVLLSVNCSSWPTASLLLQVGGAGFSYQNAESQFLFIYLFEIDFKYLLNNRKHA